MKNKYSWFLLFFIFLFLPGCAHVISKNLRVEVDPSLTFKQVLQDPEPYKGRMILWGGEIIETTNQEDRSTLIEVLQRPLGWGDEPKEAYPSEGRFLILADTYLDPYIYRRGRKITVAGMVLGEKITSLGKMDYHYPLVSSRQAYLWPVYYYPPYPYNPGWYYDPWYPGWGYPFGWGWGFGFHFRHHR